MLSIKHFILIALFVFFGGYYFSLNSDAYEKIKNYLISSEHVKAIYGKNLVIDLPFFSDRNWDSGEGRPNHFRIDINGSLKTGAVDIYLYKMDGDWIVTKVEDDDIVIFSRNKIKNSVNSINKN